MYDMPQEMFSRVVGEEQMTRLDDIQARHAKATPGPWNQSEALPWIVDAPLRHEVAYCGPKPPDPNPLAAERDAEFIAHCPDDVGWLLDRVTQLETALAKLCSVLEPLDGNIDHSLYVGTAEQMRDDLAYLKELLGEAHIFARAALDTEQT